MNFFFQFQFQLVYLKKNLNFSRINFIFFCFCAIDLKLVFFIGLLIIFSFFFFIFILFIYSSNIIFLSSSNLKGKILQTRVYIYWHSILILIYSFIYIHDETHISKMWLCSCLHDKLEIKEMKKVEINFEVFIDEFDDVKKSLPSYFYHRHFIVHTFHLLPYKHVMVSFFLLFYFIFITAFLCNFF